MSVLLVRSTYLKQSINDHLENAVGEASLDAQYLIINQRFRAYLQITT